MPTDESKTDKLLRRVLIIGQIAATYSFLYYTLNIGSLLRQTLRLAAPPQAENIRQVLLWFLGSLITLQVLISATVTSVVRTIAPPLYVDEGLDLPILNTQTGRLIVFIILLLFTTFFIWFFGSTSVSTLEKILKI